MVFLGSQVPDCCLHQINLGLWIHINQAIVVGMCNALKSHTTADGRNIISKAALKRIGDEASRRLAEFKKDVHGFEVPKKARSFVADLISCGAEGNVSDYMTIEGKTHQYLMMVSNS